MRIVKLIKEIQEIGFHRIDQGDYILAKKKSGWLKNPLETWRFSIDKKLSCLGTDSILRAVRVTVGSMILLTISIAILIPQILPVSGNSYVNAKLEWIRTPIEGELRFVDIKVGDDIKQGEILGTINNQRADDAFLNQLVSEKSSLESTLLVLVQQREQLLIRQQELSERIGESLTNLTGKTRIHLELIENELFLAAEELALIDTRVARYQKANADYDGEELFAVVSRSQLESLEERKIELKASFASGRKTMRLLQDKLDSAISGTFVSEETPLEHQQLLAVELSIATLESELSALQLKSNKLSTLIDSRKQHLQMTTHYELLAGVTGTVWDMGFSNGSYVNRGDSVVALAATDTITVEGNFHQRYLDNIVVGDPATIHLMGSKQRLKGTVTDVKIRDQVKSADLSAFNLASPETNEFKVVVAFDANQSESVYIGQRAKVIVSKSASSIVPSLLLFFSR